MVFLHRDLNLLCASGETLASGDENEHYIDSYTEWNASD